jgi:fructan beta-fructosidase
MSSSLSSSFESEMSVSTPLLEAGLPVDQSLYAGSSLPSSESVHVSSLGSTTHAATTHAATDQYALARPSIHFTPPYGWLNDPNGLVFHDGWWHLFYQYHPHSLQWGPMHWGHARSRDLLGWEHLEIALEPGPLGTAFSGSAVIDHHNSAGFGQGAMIAMFTLANDDGQRLHQTQGLAASIDGGLRFAAYVANPVISQPSTTNDFRDPKVLPYGDGWVMVLAVGVEVWIYRSSDLRTWKHVSVFTDQEASLFGTWETPDLFELPVCGTSGDGENSAIKLWVLSVGVASNAPAGGGGTHYFVGAFDGDQFVPSQPGRWADHGPDFYAAQSWNGTNDKRTWVAWMNNCQYSGSSPVAAGQARGVMSIPREVSLVEADGLYLLAQRPELAEVQTVDTFECAESGSIALEARLDHAIVIRTEMRADSECLISALTGGESGDRTDMVIRGSDRTVELVRSGVAAEAISHFTRTSVGIVPGGGAFDISVILDAGTVEVFAANGMLVLSALTPVVAAPTVSIRTMGCTATVSVVRARASL